MQTLLLGRQEETALSYVKGQVDFGRGIRYIGIESEDGETDTDIGPEKKRQLQRQIYEACMQYLGGEYSCLTFLDAEGKEECYDVGFIFCVLYAATDEFHQSFVGGRGPSVRDVGIDSLGVLIATILLDAGQKLVKLLKGRRHT